MPTTTHATAYRALIVRLVVARRRLHLRQGDVCRQLGWARTSLSKIETCQRRLDVLELHQLLGIYGMRLAEVESILAGEGR